MKCFSKCLATAEKCASTCGLSSRATRLFEISEHVVLAVGFEFITRSITDGLPDLPIQQRLFLGGPANVRSFRQDRLGPVSVEGAPRGGLTTTTASIEARFRVWRQLHGAIFYDIGNTATRAFAWEGPPGTAIGIGARYYLPVGPIRFDLGYNPGELFAETRRWAFHFAFGYSF